MHACVLPLTSQSVACPVQDLGSEWEQQAPEELRSQLGLAVRKLKDLWPAGEHAHWPAPAAVLCRLQTCHTPRPSVR